MRKHIIFGFFGFLFLQQSALSQNPRWWEDQGIFNLTVVGGDHSPANIGQAKNVAKKALATISAQNSALASEIETLMGAGVLTPPTTTPEFQVQKGVILVGQLKNLAKPFYDKLAIHDGIWLASERQRIGIQNPQSVYPWTSSSNDDSDFSPASIGQLKACFSIDLGNLPSQVVIKDSDGDGMSDEWESSFGLNPNDPSDAEQDLNSDGITNGEHFDKSTNPITGAKLAPELVVQTRNLALSTWEDRGQGDPPNGWQMGGIVCNDHDNHDDHDGGFLEYLSSNPSMQNLVTRLESIPWVISPSFSTEPDSLDEDVGRVYQEGMSGGYHIHQLIRSEVNTRSFFTSSSPDVLTRNTILESAGLQIKCPFSVPRETKFQLLLVAEKWSKDAQGNTTRTVIDDETEVLEFTVDEGAKVSNIVEVETDIANLPEVENQPYSITYDLLPVEVVELAPLVTDEEGDQNPFSLLPNHGEPLTPFVEEDPHANRIAHRELKVRIGEALKGKEVTWTLEALFVPHYDPDGPNLPPIFRGKWSDSPVENHQNAFEASSVYGANGCEIESGEGEATVAKTTVAADGSTAIRVNVPPIGLNQARVRIQIEGTDKPIDLIDMEAPCVVVIDPGHGGSGARNGGSDPNHAVSSSGVLEKAMTLDFGTLMETRLKTLRTRERLNLRIFMTRTGDVNPSLADRANRARDVGADILLSFHFNGFNTIARGTETFYDSTGNFNQGEDQGLAGRVNSAVFEAIFANDAGAINRGVKGQPLDVLSDPSLGNTQTYSPIRSVLLETEFIDVPLVDQLLNTNANHQQVRQAIIDALGDALLNDLQHNP